MAKQATLPDDYAPDFLEKLDGRSSLSRAVRSRYAELVSDLGGDLSYQRRSLAKRVIWLEATVEQAEAALARGEEVDHGALTQRINTIIGLYKTLGLERVAKEANLSDFLAARERKS